MSALWQTAKRGGQGADGRRNTIWDKCTEDGCAGRILRDDVYKDGPELCFAHASDEQRSAALLVMKTHKRVDMRGTVLTQQHVQEIVDAVASAEKYYFRSCTFTGAAPFPGSKLKVEIPPDHGGFIPPGVVDFGEATFEGGADFRKVIFPGPVFFDDTRFAGPLFFDRAHFQHEAWFLRTRMTEGAFTETTFDRLAGFHRVTATSLDFTGAVFSGRTDFDDVTADERQRDKATCPNITGGVVIYLGPDASIDAAATLDFTDATFSKRAAMRVHGRCVFTTAQFSEGLELRVNTHSTVSLRRTQLGASSAVASRSGLNHTMLENRRVLQGARVLSLQDTDVEKLSLAGVDLTYCLFEGAFNLDKLRLSGAIHFGALPDHGFRTVWNWPFVWRWTRRGILNEERLWRGELPRLKRLTAFWRWTDFYWSTVLRAKVESRHENVRSYWHSAAGRSTVPPKRGHVITGADLAGLYRSLRKAREDAKDEPGAGDFYYGEMEARRLSHPVLSIDRWLLTLYWALSGYGQRASRALSALALLLVTLTALLTGYGLADIAPIQRITDTARTTAAPPPQVITIDLTGQRATVTVPPPATPLAALDVTTVAPTLPPPDQRWTATRVQRAVSTLVTSLVPIATDQRLTLVGGNLVLLGRVLGAILLGLAALAIRARVKR